MGSELIEVTTQQGRLRGLVKKSAGFSGKTYYSFQGVPYAKPPLGKLRFMPPEPFGPWNGVWDATKEGKDTLQYHMLFKYITGDEDCLYLNVYTPKLRPEAKDAVMVWFHGGGFQCGSGSSELYGPDFLIEDDVVLVTVNSRCGVLGFLSLKNDKVPGNAGLKDQAMALRWVQDNISCFGGDPNNVTIFGNSAGAASVNYHLLSPLSKGLFHKAVLQSGCSLNPWAFDDKPKEKALLLARYLGCTSEDPDQVLNFLRGLPAIDFIKREAKCTEKKDEDDSAQFPFLPCAEVSGSAPFLSDHPRKLLERGEFTKVPTIIGITNQEGLLTLVLQEMKCEQINEDLSALVTDDLDGLVSKEDKKKLGKDILQWYTNKEALSWDVMQGYIDYITDTWFLIGIERFRQCFLQHSESPLYFYLFSYLTPRALSYLDSPLTSTPEAAYLVGSGASHGDELVLLFKTSMTESPFVPPTEEDQAFMKKFVKAWTTFAKIGNPNHEELGEVWNPDSLQQPTYLELRNTPKAVNEKLYSKRTDFWKSIYQKYS